MDSKVDSKIDSKVDSKDPMESLKTCLTNHHRPFRIMFRRALRGNQCFEYSFRFLSKQNQQMGLLTIKAPAFNERSGVIIRSSDPITNFFHVYPVDEKSLVLIGTKVNVKIRKEIDDFSAQTSSQSSVKKRENRSYRLPEPVLLSCQQVPEGWKMICDYKSAHIFLRPEVIDCDFGWLGSLFGGQVELLFTFDGHLKFVVYSIIFNNFPCSISEEISELPSPDNEDEPIFDLEKGMIDPVPISI